VLAVLIVGGLLITYWYVAVPVAVLAAAGGIYWYFKQRGKLIGPQEGPQDRWLDQVAVKLHSLGFTEQTRNTGRHLEGVPMEGDVCLDGDGLRVFVNTFSNSARASQAAQKLQAKRNFRDSMARGYTSVVVREQLVFVASGVGRPVNSELLDRVMTSVGSLPQSTATSEPAELETPTPTRADADVLEQLRKLGELRDAGVLRPEEFEAKKAELLERL
jgi:hypothetical protein